MGVLPDWMIQRDVRITPFDEGKLKPGKLSSGLSSYGYDAAVGYRFQVYSPIGAKEIDPKAFDPNSLVTVDLTPNPRHGPWETLPPEGGNPNPKHRCTNCGYTSPVREVPGVHESNFCFGPPKPDHILIPPHSFALAETVEDVEVPRDVLCVVVGKSTYARCGIITPLTPLEPEWNGKVTIEISNTTPLPARIYAGEGIMQLLFFRSDGLREVLATAVEKDLMPRGYPYRLSTAGTLTSPAQMTCRRSYADKKGRYQAQTGITHPTVDNGG